MRNRKRRKNNEPTDHSADCSDYKSSGFYVNYTNVCNYVNYFQLRLLFLRKELKTFSSLLTFDQLSKIYVLYVLPILNIFAKLHFIYHILHFLLCRIVAERTHYERDMGKRDLRGRLACFGIVHALASQERVVEVILHFQH